MKIKFENTYTKLPETFYQRATPAKFDSPELVIFNHELANSLGMNLSECSDEKLAQIFSGQIIIEGSDPIAQAYSGFQFGHPNPNLGDGRAHLLGEVAGYDIQLKGSGQTGYSRRGDGRSALGPVLREYIVSEAMHVLGVPTTRALCAVTTGENVLRQFGEEPGGVFTRVANSHLRVGTFQYFMFREDIESMEKLLNYTVNRHYPEFNNLENKEKSLAFIKALIQKQSDLIATWSSLGFIHGVMNTDNFSVAGITIDYGPCAFMDEFKFNKVFSSIDRHGRYSFYNQSPIAQWNILRLADCLLPFIDDSNEKAAKIVEEEIQELMGQFPLKRSRALARKIGIEDFQDSDKELIDDFLKYLEESTLDFTLAFRNLPNLYEGDQSYYPSSQKLDSFISRWKERVTKVNHLKDINPLYIPRNHQIEKAIELAYKGDFSHFHQLHSILKNPFQKQDGAEDFAKPPTPSQRVCQTFCGT